MSLINQMLQDLEQRGSGNLTSHGVHQQVRAVPERSGLHPAWWLVLLLTLALTGVLLWFWLRPPPSAAPPSTLALKIASDLSVLPSPIAQAPVPPDQPTPIPAASAAPALAAQTVARQPDGPTPKLKKTENLAAPEIRSGDAFRSATFGGTKGTLLSPVAEAVGDDSANAAKLTKQIKELTPAQLAENDYRHAGTALQAGRSSEAIADLEHALQLDPRHAAARQMLVGVLLQAKRMDEAVRRAQEGLSLDPAQVGLAMILARVQVEQGDVKSASATLEHSLPYAVERADYQAFLAALLQRDKRHREAIDHYVAALGKTPENGVWWMGLGISLQAENRLPEAREAFGRAKSSNTLTPDLLAFVNQKLAQLR